MPLTLRLRHDGRTATLEGVPEGFTVGQFRKLISEKIDVAPAQLLLKVGVPPRALPEEKPELRLLDAGCRDRDTVIAEEREAPSSSIDVDELPESAPTGAKPRRKAPGADAGADAGSGACDAPSSELLPAFDRAIAAATAHAKMLPEDQHQVWALRRAKMSVLESLKRGDNISLGALHTLKGVGHWVVEEVKRHLEDGHSGQPPAKRRAVGSRASAPAATPQSFQWWYVDKAGKAVTERNSAHFSGSPGAEQFRVCILHSSGRMERAWLPDAKAPPRCAPAPAH